MDERDRRGLAFLAFSFWLVENGNGCCVDNWFLLSVWQFLVWSSFIIGFVLLVATREESDETDN